MQCACAILSSVACLALKYFSTLSHKWHDCRKKKLLYTKCVFWLFLQILYETSLVLRRTKRDIVKNIHWSSCKVPVILVGFQWHLNFFNIFSKNTRNTKFHENLSRGSWDVPCERTDNHDEANRWLFLILRTRLEMSGAISSLPIHLHVTHGGKKATVTTISISCLNSRQRYRFCYFLTGSRPRVANPVFSHCHRRSFPRVHQPVSEVYYTSVHWLGQEHVRLCCNIPHVFTAWCLNKQWKNFTSI